MPLPLTVSCFSKIKCVCVPRSPYYTNIHTHPHPFNGPLSGTTWVGRYQKCKTNLDFTEARDSEWQWNLLGHMQVCTLLQTDNHVSTPPLSVLQARCPSCRPTNSVKALKADYTNIHRLKMQRWIFSMLMLLILARRFILSYISATWLIMYFSCMLLMLSFSIHSEWFAVGIFLCLTNSCANSLYSITAYKIILVCYC